MQPDLRLDLATTPLTPQRQQRLYGWAIWLSIGTIVYNLGEGLLSTWIGFEEEMLTLFGFGVDSFIELISGAGILAMVLRMRHEPNLTRRTAAQVTALRITAVCFHLLALGLVVGAILRLWNSTLGPEPSWWGTGIALVSISVMWALIWAKERVGRALQNEAILADAACARVCMWMSVVLLASSGIYVWTGFVYADALGAFGLAWLSVREGMEAWSKANRPEQLSCGCDHH